MNLSSTIKRATLGLRNRPQATVLFTVVLMLTLHGLEFFNRHHDLAKHPLYFSTLVHIKGHPTEVTRTTILADSPELLDASISHFDDDDATVILIQEKDNTRSFFGTNRKEFSVINPHHIDRTVLLEAKMGGTMPPYVSQSDTNTFQEHYIAHQTLTTFLITVILTWIVLGFAIVELRDIQLKTWVAVASLLSCVYLGLLIEIPEMHTKLLASDVFLESMTGIVGLDALLFFFICHLFTPNQQARVQRSNGVLLTCLVCLTSAALTTFNPRTAFYFSTIATSIGILWLTAHLNRETFFSIWASGMFWLGVYKLVVISCLLYLCFTRSDDIAPGYGVILITATAACWMLGTQLLNRRIRARLAERWLIREKRQSSVKYTDTGVRFRETLKGYRHDIRQPIQSLTLMLGLESHLTTDPTKAGRLSRMIDAQKSFTNMLDEMFDSLEETIDGKLKKLEQTRLDDILSPLVDEFRSIASQKQLYIRYRYSSVRCMSDPEALRRLIRNVLDNAVKYTQTGGVLVGVRWAADHWKIVIQDSGPGISSKSDSSKKGWGYGNIQIRNLAKRAEVAIAAAEIKDKAHQVMGTRVTLSIPRQPVDQPSDHYPEELADQDRSVIICGDRTAFTKSLQSKLRRLGIQSRIKRNARFVLYSMTIQGIPSGLICVVGNRWQPLLTDWMQRFADYTGVRLPIVWIDGRDQALGEQLKLPDEDSVITHDQLAEKSLGFIMADRFGIRQIEEEVYGRDGVIDPNTLKPLAPVTDGWLPGK